MILSLQYRTKSTPKQVSIMESWNELLRRHWNFALAQRLDCLKRRRCQTDRCSIVGGSIEDIPVSGYLSVSRRGDYYTQQSDIKPIRQECLGCRVKVPEKLSVRPYECHECGLEIDRIENTAITILMM